MGYPAEDSHPAALPAGIYPVRRPVPGDDGRDGRRSHAVMDEGYLAQGYYRKQRAKIKLEGEREETFTYDDYSWTEHISRKWGQWLSDPRELLVQLEQCGFVIKTKEL